MSQRSLTVVTTADGGPKELLFFIFMLSFRYYYYYYYYFVFFLHNAEDKESLRTWKTLATIVHFDSVCESFEQL